MQAEIAVKQRDCENELAKAEPLLTAAVAALDTLNKVHNFIKLNKIPLNLQSFGLYDYTYMYAYFFFRLTLLSWRPFQTLQWQ